jgi:hypothetical protein
MVDAVECDTDGDVGPVEVSHSYLRGAIIEMMTEESVLLVIPKRAIPEQQNPPKVFVCPGSTSGPLAGTFAAICPIVRSSTESGKS